MQYYSTTDVLAAKQKWVKKEAYKYWTWIENAPQVPVKSFMNYSTR